MNRFLAATAALAFLSGPALAQSAADDATSVLPPAETLNATPDGMGAAARTGDTTRSTDGMSDLDDMSTSATTTEPRDGSTVPTEGMDPSGAAAATESTPSGGIVPGQSSD